MARILVIDSYDSFVYNLVQYLGELGADPIVHRNDRLTVAEALALRPDGVLVSDTSYSSTQDYGAAVAGDGSAGPPGDASTEGRPSTRREVEA